MIKSISLRNFKCFEEETLELGQLTLLSGLNGMGKSTVLQALLLLRQSQMQGMLHDIGLELNGDLIRIGTAKDALYEDAKEERIEFGLTLHDRTRAQWSFQYDQVSDVMAKEHYSVMEEIYQSSLFTDDFHYLQAERLGPRPSYEMSDYMVRQHEQLGVRGEYAAHFLEVHGKKPVLNESVLHPSTKSIQLQDQIEAWISEVSPGTRLHLTSHSEMDRVELQYSFITGAHLSKHFRSTNVGFGITYTLPVLLALLSISNSQLILLENPESHLHPKGHARLGSLMAQAASGGCQIIVETHSDHVLNGIRVAVKNQKIKADQVKIYFFDREEVNGEVNARINSPQIDTDGRIDFWPDNFFDEWDKSLESLLENNLK